VEVGCRRVYFCCARCEKIWFEHLEEARTEGCDGLDILEVCSQREGKRGEGIEEERRGENTDHGHVMNSPHWMEPSGELFHSVSAELDVEGRE